MPGDTETPAGGVPSTVVEPLYPGHPTYRPGVPFPPRKTKMYPITNGDVVRITMVNTVSGQTSLFSLDYEARDITGSIPDGPSVLSKLILYLTDPTNLQAWPVELIKHLYFSLSSDSTVAQVVYPTRRRRLVGVGVGEGQATQKCSTPNISISCTKVVDAAYRGAQAHMNINGIPDGVYDAGFFLQGFRASISNACKIWGKIIGILPESVNFYPIVFNPRRNPITKNQILDAVARDTVRVNRRRTVGLGI